jgi:signal transduction histidine kinase
MKRNIIGAMVLFSLFLFLGGGYIITRIEKATGEVDNLLRLHRIEILREHFLIHLKRVQSDLYLKNTRYAQSVDTVVGHVHSVRTALNGCFDCHHTPVVVDKLADLKRRIEEYESALSRIFTLRANRSRLEAEEDAAFKIGTELISEVDDITTMTNLKLTERTQGALIDIARTKKMFYLVLIIVPCLILILSVYFFRRFTRPVDILVTATRHLKAGDMDFRVEGLRDEYGEVASSFNEMASSLKQHYQKMQWAEQIVVLGELTGGLAHEMKNPIAGAKGAMQVILGDPSFDEDHRTIFRKVIEQIERIEFFLKSLLNLAQPPKPNFQPININDLIDKTVSLVEKHPLMLSKKAQSTTIVKKLDSRLPQTMADPLQIQQILTNLLLNAAEAMPNGGVITAQTWQEASSPYLSITITDTGSGIDDGIVERIFQPFFTTKSKGTGLGLSITKRLVQQHGGSIRVTSSPGSGASFTVDLPIVEGTPRSETSTSALSLKGR